MTIDYAEARAIAEEVSEPLYDQIRSLDGDAQRADADIAEAQRHIAEQARELNDLRVRFEALLRSRDEHHTHEREQRQALEDKVRDLTQTVDQLRRYKMDDPNAY